MTFAYDGKTRQIFPDFVLLLEVVNCRGLKIHQRTQKYWKKWPSEISRNWCKMPKSKLIWLFATREGGVRYNLHNNKSWVRIFNLNFFKRNGCCGFLNQISHLTSAVFIRGSKDYKSNRFPVPQISCVFGDTLSFYLFFWRQVQIWLLFSWNYSFLLQFELYNREILWFL